MFRVLFLEIDHLSIMRNPPYLKAEIYILNHKKSNKKVKFQWKFLIVKRKTFPKLAPEPRKIGTFQYFLLIVFKKFPASGGSALEPPGLQSAYLLIYSFSFVCSRSKICLHRDEKSTHFFIKFSNFYATFNFKFRVPLGLPPQPKSCVLLWVLLQDFAH